MESEHPNLASALVAALAGLSVVEAGHKANAGTYSYDYASIADVVKVTRPVLAEHGLVALTPVKEHGTGLECTVVLIHSSGERMEFGPFPFPFGRDAQATGSMVTYHRRYALVSALGMGVGEDDDGAGAAPSVAAVPSSVPQEPRASEADHVSIRNLIASLADAQRPGFLAWWKDQRLPGIKTEDALTDAQASLVYDHFDALAAQDVGAGEGTSGTPGSQSGGVGSDLSAIPPAPATDVVGEGPEVSATPVVPSPPHTEDNEDEARRALDAQGLLHPDEDVPTGGGPADARRALGAVPSNTTRGKR